MPEKKVYDLIIDPEFRDLIPPLNEEELKLLEASIVADGCESPLIVWNGVIVDGHNRYAICQKHEIPFAIQEKDFSSRDDAMLWMLRNQLGRRNLRSSVINCFMRPPPACILPESGIFHSRSARRDPDSPRSRGKCDNKGIVSLQPPIVIRTEKETARSEQSPQ